MRAKNLLIAGLFVALLPNITTAQTSNQTKNPFDIKTIMAQKNKPFIYKKNGVLTESTNTKRPISYVYSYYDNGVLTKIDSVALFWKDRAGIGYNLLSEYQLEDSENVEFFQNLQYNNGFQHVKLLDFNGLLKTESYAYDTASFEIYDSFNTIYNGNVLNTMYNDYDSIIFGYTTNNKITSNHYYVDQVLEQTDSVKFDTNGNVIFAKKEGNWDQYTIDYTYNTNNKLVEIKEIDGFGNSSMNKIVPIDATTDSLYVYYGPVGNENLDFSIVIKKNANGFNESLFGFEAAYPTDTLFEYKYINNTNGLYTNLEIYEYNGSVKELQEEFQVEYTAQGYVKQFTYRYNDNNVFIPYYRVIYDRDTFGNVVKYQTKHGYDVANDTFFNHYNDKAYEVYYETLPEINSVNKVAKVAVNAYPNPAKDMITVKAEEKVFGYEIYDIQGRIVSKTALKENQAVETQVDISRLNQGNYILQVITAKGNGTLKFTKN